MARKAAVRVSLAVAAQAKAGGRRPVTLGPAEIGRVRLAINPAGTGATPLESNFLADFNKKHIRTILKMTVKERITKLLEALNDGLYERENEIKLALLASIAGESIFFLGPPGVAKSLVARRLKYAYKDAIVFEYLMSRFSTPDEIFGPVSISELKQDRYVRVIDGYLPDAEVVFLDEIWKAGPSIQNALLTVINEKKFRGGKTAQEIKDEEKIDIERDVPMKVFISASNELPDEDAKKQGQSLEALWDRLLVRLVVEGIVDVEKFNKMIAMSDTPYQNTITDKITNKDYLLWREEINKISIPENVLGVIQIIRNKINVYNNSDDRKDKLEKQIYVSDRRWHKIVRLLRTSAFLNDRASVDLMDCFLIKHCIWNHTEQQQIVSVFVNDAVRDYGYTVSLNLGEIKKEIDEFKEEIDIDTVEKKDVVVPTNKYNGYYEIKDIDNNYCVLIKQADFDSLSGMDSTNMRLSYWDNQQVHLYRNGSYYNIQKGNSEFAIIINGNEYDLETTTKNESFPIYGRPNQYTEKAWDERVNGLLLSIGDKKSQIKDFQENDLKHIHTNLFVTSESEADTVESHITETRKELEKIELDIREMQNGYKILKNELVAP